ncbi:MAG: hypothetical protein AAF514_17260, partial [Verrucomicrobiota bacterium]
MLQFIVPLQSPEASKDWKRVSLLCCRTIRSICAQTDDHFQVLLIANQLPADLPDHPALRTIVEPFPPPKYPTDRMVDKWRKVQRGLIEVRSQAPFHTMIVDADDCVSRRLSSHVHRKGSRHGWILDRGFLHDEGSRTALLQEGFDLICGTSSIVYTDRDDLPESMDENPGHFPILANGHTGIRKAMKVLGKPLRHLPFAGSCYILGTNENHSQFSLRNRKS